MCGMHHAQIGRYEAAIESNATVSRKSRFLRTSFSYSVLMHVGCRAFKRPLLFVAIPIRKSGKDGVHRSTMPSSPLRPGYLGMDGGVRNCWKLHPEV